MTHSASAGQPARPGRAQRAVSPGALRARKRAVRTRVSILTMIAVGLPTLSACGAGFNSAVDKITADNAAGQVNGVLARALVLVKGRGATSAALAGTLINRSSHDDVLATVTFTDDAAGSQSFSVAPNLPLASGQLIPLGAEQRAPITIPDARAINIGDFVSVVLHFQNAGDMRLQVAAAERKYFYADVVPVAPTAPAVPATQGAAPGAAAYSGTQVVTGQALSAKRPTTAAPAQPTATPKPTKAAQTPAAKPTATKAPAKAVTTPKPAVAHP